MVRKKEGRKQNKGLGWILKNCDDCLMIDMQLVGQQGEYR